MTKAVPMPPSYPSGLGARQRMLALSLSRWASLKLAALWRSRRDILAWCPCRPAAVASQRSCDHYRIQIKPIAAKATSRRNFRGAHTCDATSYRWLARLAATPRAPTANRNSTFPAPSPRDSLPHSLFNPRYARTPNVHAPIIPDRSCKSHGLTAAGQFEIRNCVDYPWLASVAPCVCGPKDRRYHTYQCVGNGAGRHGQDEPKEDRPKGDRPPRIKPLRFWLTFHAHHHTRG